MFRRQGWISNFNVSVTTQIQCKHEYEYVLQYLLMRNKGTDELSFSSWKVCLSFG